MNVFSPQRFAPTLCPYIRRFCIVFESGETESASVSHREAYFSSGELTGFLARGMLMTRILVIECCEVRDGENVVLV